MHYILGNPTGDNTETQPVDVTAAPDPPNPIAPVISPPLTSQERRDKYQKVEDGETPFIYDPENPKTPPRKIRKKRKRRIQAMMSSLRGRWKRWMRLASALLVRCSLSEGFKRFAKLWRIMIFDPTIWRYRSAIYPSNKHVLPNQTVYTFNRSAFCRCRRNSLWIGMSSWIFVQSVDADGEEDEEGVKQKRKRKVRIAKMTMETLGPMKWKRLGPSLLQNAKMTWTSNGTMNMVRMMGFGLGTGERKRKLGIAMHILIVRYPWTNCSNRAKRRFKLRRRKRRRKKKKRWREEWRTS